MTIPVSSALVVLLSLVGLWDALYFTFAYYGRVRKFRWVPEILCAREGSNCVTVVQTPYARVFGVPNSLFGIFYYLALLGWVLAGRALPASISPVVAWGYLVVSVGTVLLGFYLVYALIKKLGTHCPLCYLAHSINVLLLVLLILQVW
jgi:uncharacterized membrane protein